MQIFIKSTLTSELMIDKFRSKQSFFFLQDIGSGEGSTVYVEYIQHHVFLIRILDWIIIISAGCGNHHQARVMPLCKRGFSELRATRSLACVSPMEVYYHQKSVPTYITHNFILKLHVCVRGLITISFTIKNQPQSQQVYYIKQHA